MSGTLAPGFLGTTESFGPDEEPLS
jgi:hypothetical protein